MVRRLHRQRRRDQPRRRPHRLDADLDVRRRAVRHRRLERDRSSSGSTATASNASWNAGLATNGTATFGFQGSRLRHEQPGADLLRPERHHLHRIVRRRHHHDDHEHPADDQHHHVDHLADDDHVDHQPDQHHDHQQHDDDHRLDSGTAIYASPSGSASAAGTISAPTTIANAITKVAAGGTIYLRAGTYSLSTTQTIAVGNNGTSSARKTLAAYPGEKPVLDFSAMAEADSNRGLAVNGNYWHIIGITVQRAGDNGIFVGGSNNIIERVVTMYNHDSGLQISRAASSTAKADWPANNLVLSSESHDNADSDGEDADGFASKLTSGNGNVFRYTVSHHNIDDGWDLYAKSDTGPIGPVTIEDSLSYSNGTLSNGTVNANGDRNGYKLGGSDIAVAHIARRSIAYKNGHHGFTYNSNPGSMTIWQQPVDRQRGTELLLRRGLLHVHRQHLLPVRQRRQQRQDRRHRRQQQPVLDRHQRLPLRQLQRRPGLVLRLRRQAGRDASAGTAFFTSLKCRVSIGRSLDAGQSVGAAAPATEKRHRGDGGV